MISKVVDDTDFSLYHGDCTKVLRSLPASSVHCCVTSPPYFQLRDYDEKGQIGLEETLPDYVARLVEVFREVKRVLRDDGSLWLNLGDSYTLLAKPMGMKPKDLMGVPWRVAFALQDDGWYLRSDIIWEKKNAMPESVSDRPTKSHEYLFLLTKEPKYYFDQEAVREPHTSTRWGGATITQPEDSKYAGESTGASSALSRPGREWNAYPEGGRNVRTVWSIATESYGDSHFATFPQELPRRCIKAGTSEGGCCPECGNPWERLVEKPDFAEQPKRSSDRWDFRNGDRTSAGQQWQDWRDANPDIQLGWAATCGHAHEPVPCTVLDPFMGSGTTAVVARALGRHSIGIDLNRSYCNLAAGRLAQQSLLA